MKENIRTVNCEFRFKCSQVWENLSETGQKDVRFCNLCQTNVYFAENEKVLDKLRDEGKCVAVYQEIADTELDGQTGMEMLLGIIVTPEVFEPSDNPIDQKEIDQKKEEKIIIKGVFEDLRKNISGYVLNDCEPGLDGAVYAIERNSSDSTCWDLYKCCEIRTDEGIFVEVEKVGVKLSVETLYEELSWVNIYLRGHEAIAFGLPYHRDSFGFY